MAELKYARIIDNVTGLCEVAATNNHEKYINRGFSLLEIELSDKDGGYYLVGKAPTLTQKEKENMEVARVKSLTATKREFALYLYEKLGISYFQLKNIISSNELASLEWDLCTTLIRNNPMIDLMAEKLKVTSQQLDEAFIYIDNQKKLFGG